MFSKFQRSFLRGRELFTLVFCLSCFLSTAEAFTLSVQSLTDKTDYFSKIKPLKKDTPLLELIESCEMDRDCKQRAEKIYKKSEYKVFSTMIESLVVKYSIRNKRPLKSVEFLDLKNISPYLLFRLVQRYERKDLQKFFNHYGEVPLSLKKYLNRNPGALCKLSFDKKYVQERLNEVQKREDFFEMDFSKFPCGLDLSGKFLTLKTEQKNAKKRKSYKYNYKFEYLKKRISLKVYKKNIIRIRKNPSKVWKRILSYKPYIQKRIIKNLFYKREYKTLGFIKTYKSEELSRLYPEARVYPVKSLVSLGEYEEALRVSKGIEFKTSKWSEEILMMRASILMRTQKFLEASKELEKLLNLSVDLRLSGLYWLWVCANKLGRKKLSKKTAEEILESYPFSYYGINVALKTEGVHFFDKYLKTKKVFTESFERVLSREEQETLRIYYLSKYKKNFISFYRGLEEKLSVLQRALFSLVFVNMGKRIETIRSLNNLWDQDQSLRARPFVLESFARPELQFVRSALKNNKWMAEQITYAVMRQESAFNPRAQSAVRARGLMQLLHSTAKDIAKKTRFKGYINSGQLFDPNMNITLGTKYMNRLIKTSHGYLPYAFASYNAGLGRMYQWGKSRSEVMDLRKDLENMKNWPIDELWVEELPWSETRFYVKALLRNVGIYLAISRNLKPFKCKPFWHCLVNNH